MKTSISSINIIEYVYVYIYIYDYNVISQYHKQLPSHDSPMVNLPQNCRHQSSPQHAMTRCPAWMFH